MNKLDERRKEQFEKFKEKIQDEDDLKWMLFTLFDENEYLKTSVRDIKKLVSVNVSAKRLILPSNEILLHPKENLFYYPKKNKKTAPTAEIFEEQKN